MPSADIDGSPVLILTQNEALRIRVVMTQVILDAAEQVVFDKITNFLRDGARMPYSTELPRPGDVMSRTDASQGVL